MFFSQVPREAALYLLTYFFLNFRITQQGQQFHNIYDPNNAVDWHLRPDHNNQYFPNRPDPAGFPSVPSQTKNPNLGHYAHYVPTAATTNDRQIPTYPGVVPKTDPAGIAARLERLKEWQRVWHINCYSYTNFSIYCRSYPNISSFLID